MRVLTVYAHPNPSSFSHAALEHFTRGLTDAGHEPDVLDLYALKFDPVFTDADMATWLDPGMPPDVLEAMNPRQRILDGARGPIQRFLARRFVRGKDNRQIAQFLRDHFSREDYDADWAEPMRRVLGDWSLHYPGIEQVEVVYFHRAAVADELTLRRYLEQAYALGRDFAVGLAPVT